MRSFCVSRLAKRASTAVRSPGLVSRKYAQSRRNTDRVAHSQSRVVRGDRRNGQRKGIEVNAMARMWNVLFKGRRAVGLRYTTAGMASAAQRGPGGKLSCRGSGG